MKISVQQFMGRNWQIPRRYLKDAQAEVSVNCNLRGFSLKPIELPGTAVATVSEGAKTIYRAGENHVGDDEDPTGYGKYWFESQVDADFVRGQIAGDQYEWTFFTAEGNRLFWASNNLIANGAEMSNYQKNQVDDTAVRYSGPIKTYEISPDFGEAIHKTPSDEVPGSLDPQYPQHIIPCGIPNPDVAIATSVLEYETQYAEAELYLTAADLENIDYEYGVYGSVDKGVNWEHIPVDPPGEGKDRADAFIDAFYAAWPDDKLEGDTPTLTLKKQGDGVLITLNVTGPNLGLRIRYADQGSAEFYATARVKEESDPIKQAFVAIPYPCTTDADFSLLHRTRVTVRFAPGVEEWTQLFNATTNALCTVLGEFDGTPSKFVSQFIAPYLDDRTWQGRPLSDLMNIEGNDDTRTLSFETKEKGSDQYIEIAVETWANGSSGGRTGVVYYPDYGSDTEVVRTYLPATFIIDEDTAKRIDVDRPTEMSIDDSEWFPIQLQSNTLEHIQNVLEAVVAPNGQKGFDTEIKDGTNGRSVFAYSREAAAPADSTVRFRVYWDGEKQEWSADSTEKDPGDLETRVYIWTRVKKFYTDEVPEDGDEADYVYTEWESGPSPASDPVDVYVDQSVKLYGVADDIRTYDGVTIDFTHVRVYRSVAGSYLFLTEVEQAAETNTIIEFVDDKKADELGEVCPSMDWNMAPDNLYGIVAMPNGMMAGFTRKWNGTHWENGRDVYFCEPYKPHAWPVKYMQSVNYPIVGLAAMDTTLAVLTTGSPFFLQGSHPDYITVVRSDVEQSCVSKHSIVEMNGIVLYASPDGLVRLSTNGSELITKDIIGRRDWQILRPETIRAYHYDRTYVGITSVNFDGATGGGIFTFDFDNGQVITAFPGDANQFGPAANIVGYNDLRADKLFLKSGSETKDAQGNPTGRCEVMPWRQAATDWYTGSGYAWYTWRSKLFSMPRHTSFSSIEVDADTYNNLYLKVWVSSQHRSAQDNDLKGLFKKPDGSDYNNGSPPFNVTGTQLINTYGFVQVTSRLPIRLPVHPARDWQFELRGTDEVFALNIASSMEELQGV